MDIASIKRNSKLAEDGVWVDDIPGMPGLRLRVRGLSSPTAIATRSRLERGVARKDRNHDGTLKPKASREIAGKILFESVLLDWDGLANEGEPQPYDRAVAEELLVDPDYSHFADAVGYAASIVDNGFEGQKDEAAKN